MRPATTLIICNGQPPSHNLIRQLARQARFIIAADGGANGARKAGIVPDMIIGDLDSITPSTRKHFASTRIVHINRQDNTDLEKVLDYCLSNKRKHIVIVGATGRRLDFTLGNLSVVWKYAGRLDIRFESDECTAVPAGKRFSTAVRIGAVISLIPFGECRGITLRGLKYPLVNATMNVGEIGVSNVAVQSRVTVIVQYGNMMVLVGKNYSKARQRP